MDDAFKIMIIIAFVVGIFIYFEIAKLTKRIDETKASPNGILNFYSFFYKEIENCLDMLLMVQNDCELKIDKQDFEERIDELKREVEYSKMLNSNRDIQTQDEVIFKILSKIDELAEDSFDESEQIMQVYKSNLEKIYLKRGF